MKDEHREKSAKEILDVEKGEEEKDGKTKEKKKAKSPEKEKADTEKKKEEEKEKEAVQTPQPAPPVCKELVRDPAAVRAEEKKKSGQLQFILHIPD